MKNWLPGYLGSAIALMLLDAAWLGWLMADFYQVQLGPLLLASPRLVPAALFYLLYPVGLLVFAVLPGLAAGRWSRAASLGALLGVVAYGTYDLSNLATLQGWPLSVAIVDIAWGAVVSFVAAAVAYGVVFLMRRSRPA